MQTILIAVTGETPQILTESIYFYLYKNQKFDKIIVLTTGKGAEKLQQSIFDGKILEKLFKAVDKPATCAPFSKKDIIIFEKEGHPIMDVRTDDDINAATKTFYQVLQKYTAMDDTKIIANIAGGRKNMGASLALGMQLFGRIQDEMVHVLVDERVENKGTWFYPQNEKEKDFIDVSSIPFIRVRDYVKNANLFTQEPDEILNKAQSNLDKNTPITSFKIIKNVFNINDDIKIKISPIQSVMVRLLAKQKLENCTEKEPHCHDCHNCFLSFNDLYKLYLEISAREYSLIVNNLHLDNYEDKIEILKTKSPYSKDAENFKKNMRSRYITKTNEDIEKQLSNWSFIDKLKIKTINKKIGISIDKNMIEIIE